VGVCVAACSNGGGHRTPALLELVFVLSLLAACSFLTRPNKKASFSTGCIHIRFLFEADRLNIQHQYIDVTNTEATTAGWPVSMRGAFLVGTVLFDPHVEDGKVSDADFILILLQCRVFERKRKECSNGFSFPWTGRNVLNKRYQSLHA
jgi:hypothetical protein